MSNTLMIIFGISFIFTMTTLGALLVYFLKNSLGERANTIFLGFASGIMIAASIWSLLLPAIELSSDWGVWKAVPAVIGFIIGGLFLAMLDKIAPDFNLDKVSPVNRLGKSTKLFLAVTLHNIPEGLAVGFAFGAASVVGTDTAFLSALGLAIGIGIQNLPEGAAVSMPIYASSGSKNKAFLFGVISGAVEPIFATLGYFLASTIDFIQPWLLSFAAGTMIFVVVEDLIPEATETSNPKIASWSAMIGFAIMMVLDVVLG